MNNTHTKENDSFASKLVIGMPVITPSTAGEMQRFRDCRLLTVNYLEITEPLISLFFFLTRSLGPWLGLKLTILMTKSRRQLA